MEFVPLTSGGPLKVMVAPRTGRIEVVNDFAQGFHGWGAMRTEKGEVYVGGLQGSKKHGIGTWLDKQQETTVTAWAANHAVGEGVRFTPDRKRAAHLMAGVPTGQQLSFDDATIICSRLMLPLPEEWLFDSRVVRAATLIQAHRRGQVAREQLSQGVGGGSVPGIDWVKGMHSRGTQATKPKSQMPAAGVGRGRMAKSPLAWTHA